MVISVKFKAGENFPNVCYDSGSIATEEVRQLECRKLSGGGRTSWRSELFPITEKNNFCRFEEFFRGKKYFLKLSLQFFPLCELVQKFEADFRNF